MDMDLRQLIEDALGESWCMDDEKDKTAAVTAVMAVLGRFNADDRPGLVTPIAAGLPGREQEMINWENLPPQELADTIISNGVDAFIEAREAHPEWTPDLSDADLARANLPGVDLTGANLYGANLAGANLYGAGLRFAVLAGTDLRGANLIRANMYKADLRGANLLGAKLLGANLYNADMTNAIVDSADLHGVDLDGVIGLTDATKNKGTTND
jgi:hypothetical protein